MSLRGFESQIFMTWWEVGCGCWRWGRCEDGTLISECGTWGSALRGCNRRSVIGWSIPFLSIRGGQNQEKRMLPILGRLQWTSYICKRTISLVGEALRFQFTKELWSFSSLQTPRCVSLPVWADRNGTEPTDRGMGHLALRSCASSELYREGRVSPGLLH